MTHRPTKTPKKATPGGSGKPRKSIQGSALAPDGSPLSAYPVGSCVLLDDQGEAAWHLIAYRIGGSGDPGVRRLIYPPTSLMWNHGPSTTRSVSDRLRVLGSAWPTRVAEAGASGAESDPVLKNLRLDGQPDLDGSIHRSGGDGALGGGP